MSNDLNKQILVQKGSLTKIMPLPKVCVAYNLTANKLNELIESGEQWNGVYFDEALTVSDNKNDD